MVRLASRAVLDRVLVRGVFVSIRDDTVAALGEAGFLPRILGLVSCGEMSLALYCREHKLAYSIVNQWMQETDERRRAYKDALDIREAHSKDEIVSELLAWLRADTTDAFDEDGNMRPIHTWPAELKRMVAGIKFKELFELQGERGEKERVHVGNLIEVKFHDKPRSVELFMRNLSMLLDRHEITGKLSLADLIAGDREKVKTPA